jgi:stage V sporulation protein G
MSEVSNVQVLLAEDTGHNKLRAEARIVLFKSLQLTGLRVYQGTKGLFVSYPNASSVEGEEYRQIFYPITRELRALIEEEVVAEYIYRVYPEIRDGSLEDLIKMTFNPKPPEVQKAVEKRITELNKGD